MSGSVNRLMKHMKAPEVSVVESVFSNWADIVGEVIGAHTRPVKIEEGNLLIEVDDPAWASEMEWMGEELVRQVREKLNTDQVKTLTVRIAKPR
jgi:predicted nucleic acid-binding Zn ribbon protein